MYRSTVYETGTPTQPHGSVSTVHVCTECKKLDDTRIYFHGNIVKEKKVTFSCKS